MPNLSTAQITGIVSLALILSGTVIVEIMEKSYYCASEDNVKECLRLSPSGITCYYLAADDLTKGDRCTGGVWEPLDNYIETPAEKSAEIIVSIPKTIITNNNNCIIKGVYCYCNPRGSLDNKRLC